MRIIYKLEAPHAIFAARTLLCNIILLVAISNALGLPAVYILATIQKSILHHVLVSLLSHQFNHVVAGHYSSCHYMRAWIHVLDAPICYEYAMRAERKSTLQGSGLVRTVGPCAQRRVPQAIGTHYQTIGTKAPCISRGLLGRR